MDSRYDAVNANDAQREWKIFIQKKERKNAETLRSCKGVMQEQRKDMQDVKKVFRVASMNYV